MLFVTLCFVSKRNYLLQQPPWIERNNFSTFMIIEKKKVGVEGNHIDKRISQCNDSMVFGRFEKKCTAQESWE